MEWFKCSERLPERAGLGNDETEYVIVCETTLTGNQNVSICGYDEDGWSDWDNFGCIDPKKITHWMPMPQPPKED